MKSFSKRASFLLLFAGTIFMLGGTAPAHAKTIKDSLGSNKIHLAGAERVAKKDLAEMRAGFINPAGFIFKFAVDIKSQIDGTLAFVRSLVVQADVNGSFQTTDTTHIVEQPLPTGTTATVLEGGTGVVVSNGEGQQTTIINQAADNFTSVILNTIDNQNISQTVNIDIVLQNLAPIMNQLTNLKNALAPAGLGQSAHMHAIGMGL